MGMTRSAGPLFACALALISAEANAQVGAAAPSAGHPEVDQKAVPTEPQRPTSNPPTADDVCRTLEEAAAENALPVEFFARVIWQESRFNASAVSPKGASGIAQFMPQTAGWHGAWLTSHRSLPGETRNYVAIITGWTADEWASGSPPQTADTTIPQGVPCTRLANLILAPKEEAKASRLTYRAGEYGLQPIWWRARRGQCIVRD
jgi:hypothetical protein